MAFNQLLMILCQKFLKMKFFLNSLYQGQPYALAKLDNHLGW